MDPLRAGPAPPFALHAVSRSYGATCALDAVSIAFEAGRTTAVIGSSGSGKSTLLRLLIGLEWPDAGEVRVDGIPLRRDAVPALRRRVGYVIQEGGLFPHLGVRDNLALLPRHLRWNTDRIDARVRELCELTRFDPELVARFPRELSGGQRQRAALMRALMCDPPTLLLDEPLGALDPIVRRELQDDLRALFARLRKTVILVTHDVAEAAFLAPRLVAMAEGRVVQDGSFADLRDAPADEFVARFIAAPRALPGRDA